MTCRAGGATRTVGAVTTARAGGMAWRMAGMFSGLPAFCCRAACLAAKGTGGGGGATLATTGALIARAGGRGAGAVPAVGARACLTGATDGATVMVAFWICPT
jgi:hypothetical protein